MPGRRFLARPLIAITALVAAAMLASAAPVAGADFPARDYRFHNYSEMVADIRAVQTAHPGIVRVFSIGQSYQGRDIWAAKISDNVAIDEAEPEVLFDALHHAREHLTVEQALYLLHLLAGSYGRDAQITSLVNAREITIIFAVNPDGFIYDLSCTGSSHAPYCAWRKNRQPNAGTSAIGTDLNRNYGYRWGCCGGSSGNRASNTYRGPAAWSAPEVRAVRDYVLGRVIGGIQQIKAHVTLHTNGQYIMWPYGYTKTNVPADMTALDHQVFVAMARAMASRNGYTAKQSSDMYITDGDQIDWLYGSQRIFSFTWELYPPETGTVWGDHYTADENIARETARNRTALLYLISVAGCPYGAIGQAQQNCGPMFDDLEMARGWTVDPDGNDTATTGRFARGDPAPTISGGLPVQPDRAYSGRYAFITGLAAGSTPSANDLDGRTTIRSVPITLPGTVGNLTFRYTFAHGLADGDDGLKAFVEVETGRRTQVWSKFGSWTPAAAAWTRASVPLAAWGGRTIRIVFEATDGGRDSLLEVGIDDVRVERP